MIGRNINGYIIIDSIGSGAFGHTYKAQKDGEIFAMKILQPEAMSFEIQSGGLKRFQREIRSLQKAKSEFVVSYIDSGVWLDKSIEHYYIVMEFVEGMNFSEFLAKSRDRLLRDKALLKDIISGILTGLYDIHNVNIIHRDLKPANIYITKDQKVKILDFGLVKMLDYSTITTKGKIVGTPLFMSPEMIEGKTIDYRSDLYSFGVLLYHIYTNEYPFYGENVFVLLNNIVQSPPGRISDKYPDISNAMENIILKLLEKQPYLRPFRSAVELRNVINEIPLRKLDIDFQQIEDKSFKQKRYFVRILHTEKTELRNFLKSGRRIDGIEIPANYVPLYKNQINDLKEFEIPYYFDPVTNRLAYSTFTNTKGLVNLPYVHDKYNRITPKTFSDLGSMKGYVIEVLEWQLQWGSSFLVAPFHFSRGLADDWLKIDLKLLDESFEYKESRNISNDLYAGICIDIEDLTDEENRLELVNKYSRTLPDGFIFYVNNLNEKTTNISQLFSYIDLLMKFKSLKRPLIAARVGTLGIGIMELGIDAFSSGIASLSSFSEHTLLLDRQVGYDMERKYYFRDLLLTLKVGIASEILERFPQFRCSCRYCNREYQLDIINTQAKQHFLEVRSEEIQLVNDNKSDWLCSMNNLNYCLIYSIDKEL